MSRGNTLRIKATPGTDLGADDAGKTTVDYSRAAVRQGDLPDLSADEASARLGQANPHLRRGFAILLEAQRYAEELGRDAWDFAVEIQGLRKAGLTSTALRWMICNGWVDHARELAPAREATRRFKRSGLLTFSKRTCFVLTGEGARFAEQTWPHLVISDAEPDAKLAATVEPFVPDQPGRAQSGLRPRWDVERHHLYLGDILVKEYKLPSPNQGTILMAFEEEGWPPRIDDPLPPSPEIDSKTRLRYTIKSLNKNQKQRVIRFMGDGTGQGILWELFE